MDSTFIHPDFTPLLVLSQSFSFFQLYMRMLRKSTLLYSSIRISILQPSSLCSKYHSYSCAWFTYTVAPIHAFASIQICVSSRIDNITWKTLRWHVTLTLHVTIYQPSSRRNFRQGYVFISIYSATISCRSRCDPFFMISATICSVLTNLTCSVPPRLKWSTISW